MVYLEEWEKKLEREQKRREKKKHQRVKVSGRGVFKLKELISKKDRS